MGYITFHTGRGGKFNNGGYKTFYAPIDFQELLNRESENLFFDEEEQYIDANGNVLVTAEDALSMTGVLDYDGIYDSYCTKEIKDLTIDEALIVLRDNGDEYLVGKDREEFADLFNDEELLNQMDKKQLQYVYDHLGLDFSNNTGFMNHINRWYEMDDEGKLS